MSDLKCYYCKGHGVVRDAESGEIVTCRECDGCGLDFDVIRERSARAESEASDREWVRSRHRYTGEFIG